MSLQNLAELGSSLNKRKVQQILESFDALDIDIPDYRELSMGDTIRKLKNAQKFLSDDSPDASKIDSILLPLLELEDINPFGAGPYDLNNTKLLFSKENSILSDINEIFLFSKIKNKTPRMVHFLVDTCAPNSEVPANVFEALFESTPEHIPAAFYGYIGGVRLEVGILSDAGNHAEFPLLGQDFFKEAKVEIKVNYVTKTIEMVRVL